jgi:hypothetical protein
MTHPPAESLRFAILHHRLADGEHWDFLLEQGDVLWTWNLESDPLAGPGGPIAARRIADHRKLYLTYEGPVAPDRGIVARIEGGTYRLTQVSADEVAGELAGRRLRTAFRLVREVDDRWRLEWRQTSPAGL